MPKLFTIIDIPTGKVTCWEKICPVHYLSVKYALSIPEQIALMLGEVVHLPHVNILLFVQDNFVA